MANPYFSNNANFGKSRPQAPNPYGQQGGVGYAPGPYGQQPGQPLQQGYGQQPGFQQAPADMASLEASYAGPSAGSSQMGRLTFDDVIMKTATVVGTVVVVAALAWLLTPPALMLPVLVVGLLGGLVLGLVNVFKKEPSPALIMAYAVFQGAFLGLISQVFEAQYSGIVGQAVLATFITFGVTLVLFRSGKVRVTPKFTKFLMIGLISYGIFGLVNLGVVLFSDIGGPFGLRTGAFGLLIGGVGVVLAAMTLIVDFDQIARGVANGVPAKFAWAAAFGLAMTLIWLYIEFLRILAILRGDN